MNDKTRVYTKITNDISISVQSLYIAAESNPAIGKFVFYYEVTIENLSKDPVKLLTRRWHIFDSMQIKREVNGEGVLGQQPEIQPGDKFKYLSWCLLNSPIGKMYGTYNFINLNKKSTFIVDIPTFLLVSDFTLN